MLKIEDGSLLNSFLKTDSEYLGKQILCGKMWISLRESGPSTMTRL